MSQIAEVSDLNFETEVLKSETPVLVDFWAPWCMPCRLLGPMLDKLAPQYRGKVKFVKINTDENSDVPQKYQILGIPTIMIFDKGDILDKQVGVLPPDQLKKFIESSIQKKSS